MGYACGGAFEGSEGTGPNGPGLSKDRAISWGDCETVDEVGVPVVREDEAAGLSGGACWSTG